MPYSITDPEIFPSPKENIGGYGTAVLPFSALLGQEAMKLALILNAVDPGIGGVLIRGEKGTGKSTAVRGLARILPDIETVESCPFSCDPVRSDLLCDECAGRLETGEKLPREKRRVRITEFPLNATEDMIIGGVDFNRAVKNGTRSIQPGLLARAHRGILYIDEVNLLEDHLIDIILDTAASGINTVEREGISLSHPSRFILIGTMNPEEGELRPQLLDRFGLCVEVKGNPDPATRVELMELKERFDSDPASVREEFGERERKLTERIAAARERLESVDLSGELTRFIAELCVHNRTAGHRADIIIARAARAYAAYMGKSRVGLRDVRYVARFALVHRSRLPEGHRPDDEECGDEHLNPRAREDGGEGETEYTEALHTGGDLNGSEEEQEAFPSMRKSDAEEPAPGDTIKVDRQQIFEIGEPFLVKNLHRDRDRLVRKAAGKRSTSRTGKHQGRYVKSRPAREAADIAFDATLRVAAPYQRSRSNEENLALTIRRWDLRQKVRERKIGNLFLFIVDASNSMAARQRMVATKGAVMSLLMDAYQKRDKTAMVVFQKREANLVLPPTSSIDLAAKLLKELPVGGRTPLSAGLVKGYTVLRNYLLKDPLCRPVVIILTDAKANIALGGDDPFEEALRAARKMAEDKLIEYIVVDTVEPRQINLGAARRLAHALKGEYLLIEDLRTQDLLDIARSKTE